MKTTYRPDLRAEVSVDDENRVRHIRRSQEYWPSEDNLPRLSAEAHLNEWAGTLQIPKEQLQNLHRKVSFYDPREQGVEYQLGEEKQKTGELMLRRVLQAGTPSSCARLLQKRYLGQE